MGGWGLCKKDLNEISPSGEPRTAAKKGEKIKEGGVKNKITINPNVQVEEIKMSRKDYKKIHKDFKSDDPKNPRTTKYVQGKGTVSMPVKFTDEYEMRLENSLINKIKNDFNFIKKAKEVVGKYNQKLKKNNDEINKVMPGSATLSNEESEQIDELSKKTLANYQRKSGTDLAKHAMDFGGKPNKKSQKKLEKRHSGIVNAASKLETKESLLQQVASAYVDEATRMKKEMGYEKGGTKKPKGPKAKDAALDAIKAKYKGQIMRSGSKQEKKVKGAKPSGGGKFKMMAVKKKETETAAKKAGDKSTQDYVNVKARTDGGLGT